RRSGCPNRWGAPILAPGRARHTGVSGATADVRRLRPSAGRQGAPDFSTHQGGWMLAGAPTDPETFVAAAADGLTLGSTSLTIVGVIAAIGVVALVFALVLRRQVLTAGEGTTAMQN